MPPNLLNALRLLSPSSPAISRRRPPASTRQPLGRRATLQRWAGTLALAAGATLLVGCASGPLGLSIDKSQTALGQDSRAQFLILHYTDEDLPRSMQILTQQKVSAHYLLSDESPPRIYQLVDENRRAWHAGLSRWGNNAGLNSSSIGIEIVNLGQQTGPDGQKTFTPYPQAQIDLLIKLVRDIVARHQIRPDHILGHSDIAPQRKIDPGPLFPWQQLAAAGLIPWPDAGQVAALTAYYAEQLPAVTWYQRGLARLGYGVTMTGDLDAETKRVLAAFQMKYRPARYDGEPDAETAALLQVLANQDPR